MNSNEITKKVLEATLQDPDDLPDSDFYNAQGDVIITHPMHHLSGKTTTKMFQNLPIRPIVEKKQLFMAINLLKEKSPSILQVYRDNPGIVFARGTRFQSRDLTLIKTTMGLRRPKDTPIDIDKRANQLMIALGFSAVRENSIFVTGKLQTTLMYGYPMVIIPLDPYYFTWSPRVRDFLVDKPISSGTSLYTGFLNTYPLNDFGKAKFKIDFKYQNTDIVAALRSGNEVMLRGTYISVPLKYYDIIGKELNLPPVTNEIE